MNKITKAVLLAALLLLIYGYMCRLVNIYFFWESKSFGWFLLIAAIILFLFSNIKYKRPKDKHSVLEKILILVFIILLLSKIFLVLLTRNEPVFGHIKTTLEKDRKLINDIGSLQRVWIQGIGSSQSTKTVDQEAFHGDLYITVTGSKKNRDLHLTITKDFDSDWNIVYEK